ncbi:MAG: tRNA pseudouridine(55) synthase TruB, partial [Candidatus Puniceispirillaceae bacterium]
MAKRRGQPVHGWVNLDKPVGMSSAKAVAIVRRVFNAAKAGHGGTLDPLASGVLPIALGEATKTVAYAMEGTKSYAFTVTWGAQTTTDDLEGDVIETSPLRPTQAAITAIIPEFTGDVLQAPPAFSAIKIDGKRAYELAREAVRSSGSVGPDGSADLSVMPEMEPRPVRIGALSLQALTAEEATFHVTCGKGTYIRSLARDMARQLGTVGHVSMLRRLAVGPFTEASSISLDFLQTLEHSAAAFEHMHPVVSALDDIPAFPISEDEAA